MGKSRLIRISNRGIFPRWRLESVGSSSKRDKMDDTSQGGWFGSGTKIAPIAALMLRMEVRICSMDELGAYLVTYDVVDGPGGKDDPRVRLRYSGARTYDVITQFSPDGFMNWSKPIGDDHVKEFRVWREYLRNARDADKDAPHVHGVESVGPAPPGETRVFLTRTAEFEAIWKHVDRYFKYLLKATPIFACPGAGRIWPKSQAGVTRMFSLGTMALCNKSTGWSTLYDYDFDEKALMSEERTFENMGKVYLELAGMLSACPSTVLALDLLRAMIEGRAELERLALAQLNAMSPIPSKSVWKAAWHAMHGDDAVIASGTWSDQHVRASFEKTPVVVASHSLKNFLKLCGVQESSDIIPAADRIGYRVITPSPPEKSVLAEARAILLQRFPETRDTPVRVYEALDAATERFASGFCLPPVPPFKEVFLRRDRLADIRKTLRTLNHEYRHIRTGAYDGTPELMRRADEDMTELLLELRRREEASWELDWEDLKTDSDVEPPPLPPLPPVPKKT
ncbi:MAG: hypothetical protein AAB554_02995 [Patescibacteria group bacterium]